MMSNELIIILKNIIEFLKKNEPVDLRPEWIAGRVGGEKHKTAGDLQRSR